MRQRAICFLVVFLLIFSGASPAQPGVRPEYIVVLPWDCLGKTTENTVKNPLDSLRWRVNIGPKIKRPVDSAALRNRDFGMLQTPSPLSGDGGRPVLFSTIISSVNTGRHTLPMGWFCRQEWKLERSTGIPFRLRIGSAAYVDWLEQKPNAIKPF